MRVPAMESPVLRHCRVRVPRPMARWPQQVVFDAFFASSLYDLVWQHVLVGPTKPSAKGISL